MGTKVLKTDALRADILDGVTRHGGFIFSEGTLNLRDLLAKAHDFMLNYGVNSDLRKDIRYVFKLDGKYVEGESLAEKVCRDQADIVEDPEVYLEADHLWNERFYDFANRMAPDGFCFGSSEGDGACVGFFKTEAGAI